MFQFNKENIKWIKGSYGLPEAVHKIKIPSVTAVINESIPDPDWDAFIAQVGKEKADQILTSAGHRGSSMHLYIEKFLTKYAQSKDISEALRFTQEESPKALLLENIPENKIEEGRNYFYKFYYSEYSNIFMDLLAVEMGIYSPTLFYRGKLDVLYKHKLFGLSLTDFKSSNGKIKKGSVKELKYKYQIGGYANALEEMYKEKGLVINRATILCVDKNSEILQEVECVGKELQEYKQKFKDMVIEYHTKLGQTYLLENI